MRSLVSRFLKEESGVTAIEYGLIAAGIGILLVTTAPILGQAIDAVFQTIIGGLGGAGGGGG